MADIELFNECIEKDKTVIDKIEDVDRLKELYQTYLQFYSFFNSEFDSFNAKLSNLSSLVTVSLGFFISIATFLVGKYVHPHCLNNIEISSVILTFIATLGLILLLI